MIENPQRRTSGLVCDDIGDETIVFDQERNVAHCLGGAIGAVWSIASGDLDTLEIATRLSLEPHTVEASLSELRDLGLLEEGPSDDPTVSRRTALGRFAKAAAVTAGPLAFTLAIPEASSAASGAVQCAFVGCGSATTYTSSTDAKTAADNRCQTQAAKMSGCKGNSTCSSGAAQVFGSNPAAYRVLAGVCVY